VGSIPTPGSGTYVAPSRQTVAGFLELWIDGARSELAITAWTNYGEIIRRYVVPYIGAKRLVDLSPLDVKAMHAALLDHGRRDGTALAVASVQLAHRVLHRALADAVRWKLIPINPATGARVPKGERKEMSVWTAEEAGTFLTTVADGRLPRCAPKASTGRAARARAGVVPAIRLHDYATRWRHSR
jgi:integrase